MLLDDAMDLALEIVSTLRPGCAAVTVAGSVRRARPTVKDIEIVAVPSSRPNLLEEPETDFDGLNAYITELAGTSICRFDRALRRNGARYKRLRWGEFATPVDLFIAPPEGFGNVLAIRTGDGSFSQALVTQRAYSGLCPNHLVHAGGRLWDFGSAKAATAFRRAKDDADHPATEKQIEAMLTKATVIACPTEEAYFAAIGIPESMIPPPSWRQIETARTLASALVSREDYSAQNIYEEAPNV